MGSKAHHEIPGQWQRDFKEAKTVAKEVEGMLEQSSSYAHVGPQLSRLDVMISDLDERLKVIEKSNDMPIKELRSCQGDLGKLKGRKAALERSSLIRPTGQNRNEPSPNDLLRLQQQVMRDQDEQLGDMERGVKNLKEYGRNIGNEADLHVKLLGTMSDDTTDTMHKMRIETDRTVQVGQKAGTFKLKLAIVILTVILIFLILFGSGR